MAKKNLFTAWVYVIIVVFGFILYGNSLKNDFALDDAIVITQNQFTTQGIKGVDEIFKYDSFVGFWLNSNPGKTPEQIQEEKRLVAGGRYRPLSLATFAIERDIIGKDPAVHHFMNLLIYILTSVVLFRLLSQLFEEKSASWWHTVPFIAVLLFMAHPLHTEVVANIKGRDELLSFLGALLAAFAYFKYLKTQKKLQLLFAFLAMFMGLLSKENAITWLAVIPVAGWFFIEKDLKKHALPMLSLVVPSIIFLLIRHSVLGLGGVGDAQIATELMNNPFLEASETQKTGTILYTLWIYIKLLFFPHPLTYDYYPYHIGLVESATLIPRLMLILYSLMLVVAIVFLFLNFTGKASRNMKWISLIILMYLAPLSVVSNVFFPVGVFMAERFLYFSSLAFVVMFALLISSLIGRIKEAETKNVVLLVILIPVLGLYSFKTIDRNKDWQDDFTLFTTDVKISENSAKANTTAGGKLLEKAKELADPTSGEYNYELADAYVDQAITHLKKAIEIHPTYVDPMLLLGNAYYQKDRDVVNAVHWYTELLKIRPYHNLAVQNTQLILPQLSFLMNEGMTKNTPDEVIKACLAFDAVKKDIPEVYRTIGLMYARYKNNFEIAIPYYNKALELNPNDLEAWKDLGVIYGQSGEFEKALEAFMKVYELNPDDPQVLFNIAVSYQNMGNVQQAQKWFAKYQAKSPNE